jgi:HNH endonuclease/helix-turn-helix resolvase-like protein
MTTIRQPIGLCQCGCGRPTRPQPPYLQRRNGFTHFLFVRNHQKRTPWRVRFLWATGCWIWLGSIDSAGYGQAMRPEYGSAHVHRHFYEYFRGSIPDGLVPDHLCRNRECVNPWHIELVLGAVNSQRGLLAKLKPEQVVEIRKLAADGVERHQLAKQFGVSLSTIHNVVHKDTWRNIEIQ